MKKDKNSKRNDTPTMEGKGLDLICSRCDKNYSITDYKSKKFCDDCGTHLRVKKKIISIKKTPSSKVTPFLNDGNLAFKCTYNDNEYSGVCSDAIYKLNVEAGRIWCKDPNNDCRKFEAKEVSPSDYPCYESTLFLNWAFGAGIKRGEKYYGVPFSIKKARPDQLAFLTTRTPFQNEEDRYIFGFLHMKRIGNKPDLTGRKEEMAISEFVSGDPETSLKFNPEVKLRFWDYYQNPNRKDYIKWGSGLFRYLSDKTVLGILISLKKKYKLINDDNAKRIIKFQISRYKT